MPLSVLLAFPMADSLRYFFLLFCFLFPNLACSCFPVSFSCGNFILGIKPPFTTTANNPWCGGSHLIKCDGNITLIQFKSQGLWYRLMNISYSQNILIVQDLPIGNLSWGSSCSFLCDFLKPLPIVNISRQTQILALEGQYFNCTTVEHKFSQEFLLQYGPLTPCRDYNFYYTQKLDNRTLGALPTNCLARRPPSFERRLLFSEDGGLSSLSAGLSHQLDLRRDCFDCQVIGNNCSVNGVTRGSICNQAGINVPGKNIQLKKIVIGVAAGGAVLLAACCLFLFLYRRQKSKQHSPSFPLLPINSSEPSRKKDPELGSTCYQTQTFSYKELEEATDGFDTAKELGDGGFGTVYKGKLRDGRTVAVKRLYENNSKRVEQFMNEIVILSRLRHQSLVTLYGCSSHRSPELLLVYEFVPNGTVADHLHGSRAAEGALTWPVRMNIAIETAEALAYLHAIEPPIIHRDVKTNNILLDNNFHVKVADFGLSRLFPVDATHVSTAPQGTPGYVDPEYHQCFQLTDKSDVYSFGVVLVELISSKLAVDVNRHRHEINLANMAINKIQNGELDELIDLGLGCELDWEVKSMTTQVAELAFKCLQWDRDIRPSIKKVLEVLRAIRSGGHMTEKAAESDASTRNDTPLLKDALPYSPYSVTDNWVSTSTTSNTSS